MSVILEKPLNLQENVQDEEDEGSEVFYLASDQINEFALPVFELEEDSFYSAMEFFNEVKNSDNNSACELPEDNVSLENSYCSNNYSLEPEIPSGQASERNFTDESEQEESNSSNSIQNFENNEISSPSESFFSNLEIVQEIGSGGFGVIFLLRNKINNTLLVDKICNSQFADDAIKEYAIMRLAEKNQYFLNTMGHMPDPAGDYYHLFMEYFPSKDLLDYLDLNILVFSEVQYILKQITQALGFLHYNNVIHRDLKPENILIDEIMNCKIIDFGLSEFGPTARGCCGTEVFCAPEVMAHRGEGIALAPSYGDEVDIYSLGITALYIGANLCPIKFLKEIFDSKFEVYDPKLMEILEKLNPDGEDENFQDLIYNMISQDPMERLNTNEILCHEFFKTIFTGKRVTTNPKECVVTGQQQEIRNFLEAALGNVKENRSATSIVHSRIISTNTLLRNHQAEKKNTFWTKIRNAFKRSKKAEENKKSEQKEDKNDNKQQKNEKLPQSRNMFGCGLCSLFRKKKNICSED